MKDTHGLNESGFVTQYLISGLLEEPFINEDRDDNQLRYETHLRSLITVPQMGRPDREPVLGEAGSLGLPWSYYYNYGNWFVDLSTFYSELTRVGLDACTILQTEEDRTVKAVLWSYASVDVWCGTEHVCSMSPPVYKPIRRQELLLHLKKGENLIYIRLQTLGVRDTRTLFGLQILDQQEELRVSLPDKEQTGPVMECAHWLSQAFIRDGILQFPSPASQKTTLGYDSASPDFAREGTRVVRHEVEGCVSEGLEAGRPYILLECSINGQKLVRRMENVAGIRPKYLTGLSFEENQREILKRTAEVESLSRGGKFGFSISNILARRAIGETTERDRDLFLETLSQIERRFDCSDFLVCGVIRYLKNNSLDDELKIRVREVLLHYRYWMDQDGSDAMCFWSENHSLMFYVSAMNAGELYPDEYFVRAGMDGRSLYEAGKKHVEEWLEDVETYGFEEFLSTVYMCVTFAGLLNAIDYTTEEISCRAAKITDRLLGMLAMHTYKGCVVAPMGRVYRQVIYPFAQGAQALMNLVNPAVPYSYGEGWLAFYATSGYRIPEGLSIQMEADVLTQYTTGNALIHLEKNRYYCLSSVQSPRMDEGFRRWENLTLLEEQKPVDKKSHTYTKSLNERFHGTTCFEPGVYGYQQHMWSAALDPEALVFTNHPGGSCDSSQMRPGYWYGNGIMPAIRQEKGLLLAIYVIPEEHPIHFTHVFWPGVKFDRSVQEGHWLFGQKADGFLGLWSSGSLESHQDQVFDCEYRTYGDEIAYCCVCSGTEKYKNLDAFMDYWMSNEPVYAAEERRLEAEGAMLIFDKREDRTQYI